MVRFWNGQVVTWMGCGGYWRDIDTGNDKRNEEKARGKGMGIRMGCLGCGTETG